ncbi:MAG TPA: POTRA domain-containing protein [Candidatus Acidoferrales bacterium]|nr:POTRA domain-containing protein [Candidatus Acidoferrales bacterium]
MDRPLGVVRRGAIASRPSSFAAFLIFLCLFSVQLVGAQGAPQPPSAATEPSAKVTALSAAGSAHFTSEQVVAETGLKVGATVTRADLQSAADKLSALGTFAKVGYRFSSGTEGVSLEYQVTDAPLLPISFDNFPWVSEADLKGAIKAAVPLFDGSAPANGKILDDMADAVQRFLETKSIYVKVSHTPMADPLTSAQTVEFVSAGAEEDVKSIDFSDALANTNKAIQERLQDLVGKPYSLTALRLFEVEQIRPVYVDQGLLRVTFKDPVIQAPPPNATVTVPTVVVHVEIDPGAAYNWGGVTWTENSALSSPELNALVPFKPGQPSNGTKIQALWMSVQTAYGHKGYLDASVTPTPKYDDQAKRVNYTVAIVEGPQYKMGNLVLSGLSLEGERRVRGAWEIAEGAVFDETFFNEFIDHGAKDSFTGMPYGYERIEHFLDKNPSTATVNVLLDFK